MWWRADRVRFRRESDRHLRNPDPANRKRLAVDLAIVGVRPTVSPDGSVPAYVTMSESAVVSGSFCPLNTLAVRILVNRTERRWTIGEGEGFSAIVWAS